MRTLVICVSIFIAGSMVAAVLNKTPSAAKSYDPLDQSYTQCLDQKAAIGDFTSSDEGRSAIRLMGQCADWNIWVQSCVDRGGTDGDCTTQSAMLAQEAIKLRGK